MVLMIVIWIWESLDGLITRKAGAAGLEPALSPALTAATMKPFVNLAANNSGSQAPRSPCKFCCKKLQWILVNHVCGNWQGEVKIEKWRIDHGFHLLPAAACPTAFFLQSFKDLPELQIFLPEPVVTWPPKCLVCQIFLSPLTNIFISAPRDSFRHFWTPPQDSLGLCIIMLIPGSRFLLFVLTMALLGSFISPRGERRNFHSIIWSMYYLVISINQ